ncbi:TPA: NACHT domain-containing protein [Candidatus Bathyarchaeota archaeon]|nr:NACHT domain-containing protein [Candidatus Bathyarchaeota archaeon]
MSSYFLLFLPSYFKLLYISSFLSSISNLVSFVQYLLDNYIKYENYLKDLIEKSKHEIDPYWVDLECSFEGAGRFSVVECVDSWLEDNTKNQLAILGEFGTGKTWFCRYYAARVAKKHLEDPLQQPRIPILISLREYTNIPDLEALITSMLINRFGFKSFSFQTFMHLNRHGQLLLIFDGFDEMEQRVDYNAAVQNYKKILGTAVSGSKVILTSRPMFFANKEKLQTILRVSKKEFALETTSLLAFEEKQIKEGLKKWMGDEWETYWESIRRIQGLEDLASRPVMTQIISEVLPGILKQGKTDQSDLNGAELYRTYIMDKWIIRAAKDTNLLEIRNEIFYSSATLLGRCSAYRIGLFLRMIFSPELTKNLNHLILQMNLHFFSFSIGRQEIMLSPMVPLWNISWQTKSLKVYPGRIVNFFLVSDSQME